MVLIPEDVLNRYEQRQRLESSPIMSNMMYADKKMSDILQQDDMSDNEKQKLYNANMERYLEFRRQKDSQIPTARTSDTKEEQQQPESLLSDSAVIEPIPKYIRPRANALLNRLKARPDVITWDKTGQIKIEGQSIPNSNISDLVSDALRSRKNFNPTGASELFMHYRK